MKIFLTSDAHIGMKFAGYPDIQEKLVNARFDALKKSIITANKNDCELFVVGGDLFDRVSVAKRDIQKAAAILSEFEGRLVAVLPGNHDFITPKQENLWTNFQSFADNNILLLQTCDVYPLKHFDIDANLYPAPCESKHSNENRIGWIKAADKDRTVKFHIGVAHGSLEGVSPDFNRDYYPMKESELMTCGIDIWLMGHTHRAYPENPGPKNKIFYPGTAEPDGFDCDHRGNALIIQLDNEKNILATPIETGTYRFLHEDKTLKKWENIKSLLSTYLHDEHKNTLLKLKLNGRLHREDINKLPEIREQLKGHLLYLQMDVTELGMKIVPEDINKTFSEHSFPHRLLTSLVDDNDHEALQIAFDLLQEVRK